MSNTTTSPLWNTTNIATVYKLDSHHAELVEGHYESKACFDADVAKFKKSYNATSRDAVTTVVSWLVTDEEKRIADEDNNWIEDTMLELATA